MKESLKLLKNTMGNLEKSQNKTAIEQQKENEDFYVFNYMEYADIHIFPYIQNSIDMNSL